MPGVEAKEVYLQVELGMIEKEVVRNRIHPLTSKQDNIEPSVDWNVYEGISIDAVAPPDDAVGVPQGESELGVALKVGPVYGDLSGIGNRCSG